MSDFVNFPMEILKYVFTTLFYRKPLVFILNEYFLMIYDSYETKISHS